MILLDSKEDYKYAARARLWQSHLQRYGIDRRTFTLIQSAIIGCASGLAALLFWQGVQWVTSFRHWLAHLAPYYVILPLCGLIGGVLCGACVQFLAPEISGSGIPQVKAVLNRFALKLDLRVAVCKLVAGAVALGIGLPLGREGPTVQLGAAIAAVFSRFGLASPTGRRQLIAAGAGAGLAAAFNAPLAGVMFILEELQKEVSSATISSAVLACFCAAVVARYLGNHSLDVSPSSEFPKAFLHARDIPFFFLLGSCAGIVGGFFNNALIGICARFDKVLQDRYIIRVGLSGLICGLVIAALPTSFREFAGIRQLIFANQGWQFAAVALTANLALTLIAYGSGTPGGLFAPSLTIGAALGFLVGCTEQLFFPECSYAPVLMALAGMSAQFAAICRVPITATVIVFEMTADFNLLLPLMISSITALLVGEKIAPGSIYDRLLLLKGIKLEEQTVHSKKLKSITIGTAMNKEVESLSASMKLHEALEFFGTAKHRGYPVIDGSSLVGVITQSDLLSRRQLLDAEATLAEVMTPHPVTATPLQSLETAIVLLDQNSLSRLPIEDNGKIVGIITRSDIIQILAAEATAGR